MSDSKRAVIHSDGPRVQHDAPKHPAVHEPQRYDGSTSVPSQHGTFDNSYAFTPPPVPSGSGDHAGATRVDTPSMTMFADNIDKLIKPTADAAAALKHISVAPGAFYHANQVRTKVNGPNADAGLKEQYIKVLADLGQGLGDLRDGIKQLAQKYTTVEEAGKMSAKDLQNAMQASKGDFTTLSNDAGGAGGGGK
ncbi:hypothetical protein [Streptomyces sp. NPDC059649]|uniref:hypothetical protein n=1 Tax=Streptomyces sp. NPDC059649 TaxID=3346895 RepID=UPI0036832627